MHVAGGLEKTGRAKERMELFMGKIAAEAETSTNSIYVRFKDKGGMFAAVVEPVSEEFMSRFMNVQEAFHAFGSEIQCREVGQYSADGNLGMVDYIYDHFDEFRLLLDTSHGTKFHDFVDRLVSMEGEYTWKWMEVTGSHLEPEGDLTSELYHMMATAYFEGFLK